MSDIREFVSHYYGELLGHSDDLKTNACCAAGAPASWLRPLLANVHPEVTARFYGCGYPIPEALEGATVLDLGCGTGRDVFVLSQLVGESGVVHGVDMTPSQLDVGREHIAWHMDRFGFAKSNVHFHEGYIEDLKSLPIAPESVDVVVSNCVVNLSPRKDLVLAEIARVLKPGGEFHVSDVFADRRLPEDVASDPVLHAECLGGAMYGADFLSLARRTGFLDPRALSSAPITIQSPDVEERVGAARFTSSTLRLFRIDGLDEACEDYGHVATYKGTAPGHEVLFALDDHHVFERGRAERVCRNTAAMLGVTRFARHFEISGGGDVHFGPFDCSKTMAAEAYAAAPSDTGSCC